MVQVAKSRYAPQQYHDFIGFRVSKPLLERVFPVVYGLQLQDVLPREDLAVGSYRFAVSRLLPEMTQVALQTHKKDMMRESPTFAKRKFLYRLSRSDYERAWGKDYDRPGFGTRVLSTLLRFMPKIGPFKSLGFDNPTAQTEELYFKSINATVDDYRVFLQQVRAGTLRLPNRDLDSGQETRAAEYTLADQTFAKLLTQLTASKFALTTPALRDSLLFFYADLSVPIDTKKDTAQWQAVLTSLDQLKLATPIPPVAVGAAQRTPLPARPCCLLDGQFTGPCRSEGPVIHNRGNRAPVARSSRIARSRPFPAVALLALLFATALAAGQLVVSATCRRRRPAGSGHRHRVRRRIRQAR